MLLTLDREGVNLAFRIKAIRVFHETPLVVDGLAGALEGSDPQAENAPEPTVPIMTAVPTEDLET